MGNLFGKSKKPASSSRVSEQDLAVLQLKKQRDQLKLYQRRIEKEQEKLRETAKKCLRDGKKEKAKLLLKKKKRQDNLMDKTEAQIDNLEIMANDIEFAQMQAQVVQGLKTGNESLKEMHKIMSYEDVEKIMEETQEGIEYQRELDELLAGSLTNEDEDAILEELDELLGVGSSSETAAPTKKVLDIPDAPTDAIIDQDVIDDLPDAPTSSISEQSESRQAEPLAA